MRPPRTRRAAPRAARARLAVRHLLAPLAPLLLAGVAEAATFHLADGATVEGVVAQAGDTHVSIRSPFGYRVIRQQDIVRVIIERPDGSGVAGEFQGWSDGYYRLSTTRGEFVIDDNGVERLGEGALAKVAGDEIVTRAAIDGRIKASIPLPPLSVLENPAAIAAAQPATDAAEQAPPTPREQAPQAPEVAPQAPDAARRPAPRPETPPPSISDAAPAQPDDAGPIASAEETEDPAQTAFAAQAAPPRGAARLPAVGSPSPEERAALNRAYRAALQAGGAEGAEKRECALLATMSAAPRAEIGLREDRDAVRVALDGQASLAAMTRLAEAFFHVNHTPPKTDRSHDRSLIEREETTIALPRRLDIRATRDKAQARARLVSGDADLILLVDPPLGAVATKVTRALQGANGSAAAQELGPQERLIAFDAIALATAPDSPIRSVSPDTLRALLSGQIDDWSMIDPTHIGRPTLYLPPEGAGLLTAVLDGVGARRARPVEPRFLPRAEDRLEAVLADPNGLALVPWSALRAAGREDAAVAIGRGRAAIAPSLDTIRSGAYPLIVPIKLRLSPSAALPGAEQFARFLSSANGQRAIFDAGLAPVAACDPSTCPLQTAGLSKARLRLRNTAITRPNVETLSAAPAARRLLAGLAFDRDGGAIDDLSALADYLESGVSGAVSVVAQAAPEDQEAARLRAEAFGLALRCAGRPINRLAAAVGAVEGVAVQVIEE